jgi:dTDP-L-rhamnose 4-epimerase
VNKTILITGGAGFIGQKLSFALIEEGFKVRIIDNFHPQVHAVKELPPNLAQDVDLITADIRDVDAMRLALKGVDALVHLAAETGTGQSMYEIDRYFSVNVQGTAVLLDLLQNDDSAKNVKTVVVASSRAIYGEGAYSCSVHGVVYPEQRGRSKMEQGYFEPMCPICEATTSILHTTEAAPFKPMSIYGLTKQVQEQAVLLFARTKGINGFALRYQNVYGPGQSLKNPYTGILAVFSNLARQNQVIEIYEDGLESRDFVYIDDVVEATKRCLTLKESFVGAMNVGSGIATTVTEVAQEVKKFFKSNSEIRISGAFRVGDIRHNIADITQIKSLFNFTPSTTFKEGLSNFLSWAATQEAHDRGDYSRSVSELNERGLMGTSNSAAGEE